ncbi:hypothetical protein CERZMDRAFT_93194 [Cercospora zeae-maydis SCOH1-5]|uniref:SUN domain-containing protein n=1 Tax=Cercospora zeae-maydis SCOH1-5 TaxID=717836 RepID=A0A6A6FUP3_9PEZI|nr:hypothetical protein CERZMDRAFT_93194 [Cercospora zeae-maydis SCOH1-5]
MVGGATPRATRSRNGTPLPAVPSRQSHAYGAQGKAALEQQVTTSAADVNAAFTTTTRRSQRTSTRQLSHDTATPAPPTKLGRKSKTAATVIEEEDDFPEINGSTRSVIDQDETAETDDEARPGTSLQHSAAYINAPFVAPARPLSQRMPARTLPPPADASPDDELTHQPWLVTVFFHTMPRYIKAFYGQGWRRTILLALTLFLTIFLTCALFFLGLLGAALVPLPANWEPYRTACIYRTALIVGLPGYDRPPQELELRWQRFTHDEMFSHLLPQVNVSEYQWVINAHLLGRIEGLENQTEIVKQHQAANDVMVAELQKILPMTTVLEKENGELVIPQLFWQALAQKMESSDASPIWERFISTNEEKYRAYSNEVMAGNFEDMAKSHHLLTQGEFHDALSKHSLSVHHDLDQIIRKFRLNVLEEARSAARDVLEKSEIMSLARQQIRALGHANYVYNLDKKLNQINYFSTGLGAMVDPHYTSATKMPSTTTIWQSLLHISGFARQYPHPPSMALTTWEEATDAWCAETSKDEKAMAQLTVKTAHKINPTEVTIEHIPASGTRDVSAAPRDFEVWAQVANKTEADRINASNVDLVSMHTSVDKACKTKPPNGESNWVCLAGEQYDVNWHNFVQSFTIWPDLASDRIAIRVLSNWGSPDHTCLYRVRVTGTEVQ